jgi:hypothetical protein
MRSLPTALNADWKNFAKRRAELWEWWGALALASIGTH